MAKFVINQIGTTVLKLYSDISVIIKKIDVYININSPFGFFQLFGRRSITCVLYQICKFFFIAINMQPDTVKITVGRKSSLNAIFL